MNRLEISNFNPDLTLLGGQGLTWEYDKTAKVYYGVTSQNVIELKKYGKDFLWQTYPNLDDYEFIRKYFRLDLPYREIIDQIAVDSLTKSAVSSLSGLRLISQPFADTVIMFISSTNRNIPLIKQSIRLLYTDIGQRVETPTGNRYLFPDPAGIADLELDRLFSYKLGYRAPFIKEAAQRLLDVNYQIGKSKVSKIKNKSFEAETRSKLLRLPGVGPKVADCIMSFSLGFDDIIPQDVWMRRIFGERYDISPTAKYQEVVDWYRNYWGKYAAWAGQFLFEFLRKPH
ncbi:hypothetical protein JW962_04100 [Candidatus Dojkabacteria bacterium]|nr:hypothetical protein [Candidatus Dojkabacteria bacterium]